MMPAFGHGRGVRDGQTFNHRPHARLDECWDR
jgi:hypothetical protein